MVGAGQDRVGACGAAGLGHHVCRCRGGGGQRRGAAGRRPRRFEVRSPGAKLAPAAARGHQLPLGIDLVEPGGQAFGEPAGIGEHNRGLVGQHQVHDLFLHVRPDRCLRLQPGCGSGVERAGGALQVGHVLHRDRDRQIPGLLRGRGHDFHRCGAGEELGHQFLRLDGGRESDPLGGFREQSIKAFQGHGQVGAAFGARNGMDLVDDDGVHLAQRLPRLGREHEEQRFGCGDQDVRRVAQQRAAVRRRGITGADAHGDQRGRQAEAFGSLDDPDQRRAEVAFDVDA
ncbi:hypothetical protein BJQ90_02831 [Arthrobacter sp. SO3]|nr:hypothetical protein [Arthrobacter sp. SO3]